MGVPPERPYRILVYAIERKEICVPRDKVVSGKFELQFAKYGESIEFQRFNGVIVLQGTFEAFERVGNNMLRSYLNHDWDRDELDKRTKEVMSLIEAGGFVCMLLTDPFIDFDENRDFRGTDLSKRLLGGIHRSNFASRTPVVVSKVNELASFFKSYGAAWSSLEPHGDRGVKVLAVAGRTAVSIVVDECMFFVPTLVPSGDPGTYFSTLASGVVSLWERLKADVPEWATDYRFPLETDLESEKLRLSARISEIDEELGVFKRFKRVLTAQSEPLVEAVAEVLERLLPLKPRREEAFREDLVLTDHAGDAVALVEIKGVNRGVAREHVNQADSHRERAGQPPEFPSLLIINTNMKNATSIRDKNQEVASEQVQHAARNNVLILRTLDLLNLASLHLSGKLDDRAIIKLLTTSRGWLKVGATAEVLTS